MTRYNAFLTVATALALFVLWIIPVTAQTDSDVLADHEARIAALEEKVFGTSTTTSTTTPTTTTTLPTPTPEFTVGMTWQWQIDGTIDTTVKAAMFNVDLFEAPQSKIDTLKSQGKLVVCYMAAGSWEDFRPDANAFPESVKGRTNGWPGERWLDIRQIDILGPIMEARLDLCAQKGFDGVEFDLIDGWTNNTGFPLTAADQTAYNLFLANTAHERGLAAGFKNNVEQAAAQEPYFDFAVNEECLQYNECGMMVPFIAAGKPVFHAEYVGTIESICVGAPDGFSSIRKRLSLRAWLLSC